MEHHDTDPLGPRRRTLITGAGGQLGTALARAFGDDDVLALDRRAWDVRDEPPALPWRPDLVLHTAAWTNVDGAEDDPQGAAAANVGGTTHVAALGVPLVAYSSDYVFDGRKDAPYVESDSPSPLSAYGRTKLHGEAAAGDRAWVVRSSWLFAETGHNFVRTMLRLGAERDEVAVVDDQRGCPTYVGHLAEATRELLARGEAFGVWHLAADGECTCAGSRWGGAENTWFGVRRARAEAGVLGAAQREGGAGAPALARRPACVPRSSRLRLSRRGECRDAFESSRHRPAVVPCEERVRLPGAAAPGSPSPWRNASPHHSGYSRGPESRP